MKIHLKFKENGGAIRTVFAEGVTVDGGYDLNDLPDISNIDKFRIDSSGKVVIDVSIETEEEKIERFRQSSSDKFKSMGLTEDEIKVILG